MTIGYFVDKNELPAAEAVEHALGENFALWERLARYIDQNYKMAGEWNFGGKKYGWNCWYRKGGKTLVTLYPQQGGFVAQVVLGRLELEKALALELGEAIGRQVRETPMLHDGKWLFLRITTAEEERDIEQLLLVKRRPTRAAKQGDD